MVPKPTRTECLTSHFFKMTVIWFPTDTKPIQADRKFLQGWSRYEQHSRKESRFHKLHINSTQRTENENTDLSDINCAFLKVLCKAELAAWCGFNARCKRNTRRQFCPIPGNYHKRLPKIRIRFESHGDYSKFHGFAIAKLHNLQPSKPMFRKIVERMSPRTKQFGNWNLPDYYLQKRSCAFLDCFT